MEAKLFSSISCLQRASLEVTPSVNIVEEKNVWPPYFIKFVINVLSELKEVFSIS